jgi:SsrA-binding protein
MAGDKNITVNRKAYYDYHVLERIEAGLVLTGTEIKSIRAGGVNIRGSYARPRGGELWLLDAHIAPYKSGGLYNHEPNRPRKLLLHKGQMVDLISNVSEKGLSIVPLRVYIRDHIAKVELGLVRGKHQYDKRRAIMDRELDREARRAMGRAV